MTNSLFCIEGNIGAGRSQLAQKVSRDNGWQYLGDSIENPFLQDFHQSKQKVLETELWFLLSRKKIMSQAHHKLKQNHVILDFHPSKSDIFKLHNLQQDQVKIFEAIQDEILWRTPRPEWVLYIHKPVKELAWNIKMRNRPGESEVSLAALEHTQKAFYQYFKNSRENVLWLDCSGINLCEDVREYQRLHHLLSNVNPVKGFEEVKFSQI